MFYIRKKNYENNIFHRTKQAVIIKVFLQVKDCASKYLFCIFVPVGPKAVLILVDLATRNLNERKTHLLINILR